MQSNLYDFVPILMQVAFSVVFVFATIFISNYLGPKHRSSKKNQNFECGIESIGDARTPFAVKYFLVAILFVLFDIEIIFMYPWAINFKTIGISGLLKMGGFISLLLVGYLYIVKRKALEWEK
ncbi:NADH-quinone oxidoreductase subunit A [Dysgonomonas alginatilytica]|uniref:NADH-quinone oxidoreductase subunit A n=1 Tax=Dysgonomonas alginatilytica TaxID=1605892 RepID=A0A2V3PRI4_9BACT|nr:MULTISPECIES: NADH-quinone oxidoreductase subunit A [Dysgonomonas]MBD8347691.1 NADH-quinone oxidoreductase subunit A [Dysgonomonas sp. HGC4]MBF0577364.1 NADH-quinone oxidoreductase subunit A [Dysgonomonas sp. GY617]PXV60238.1 NADH-quinone oxidoreductase subunit A [Dysgonomonas alginatilytica]